MQSKLKIYSNEEKYFINTLVLLIVKQKWSVNNLDTVEVNYDFKTKDSHYQRFVEDNVIYYVL